MHAENISQGAKRASMKEAIDIVPFNRTLSERGLKLEREKTSTLQINMGLVCNQTCRHCHLDAGPGRKEIMDIQIFEDERAVSNAHNSSR